jgi:hypothetical protein
LPRIALWGVLQRIALWGVLPRIALWGVLPGQGCRVWIAECAV